MDRVASRLPDGGDRLRISPIPPPQSRGTEKSVGGPPPQPTIRQAILDIFMRPQPSRCLHCNKLIAELISKKSAKVVLGHQGCDQRPICTAMVMISATSAVAHLSTPCRRHEPTGSHSNGLRLPWLCCYLLNKMPRTWSG